MKKNKSEKPTQAELEILQVLWKSGASPVRLVNDELCKKREVGYTTTLKLMQNMFEKGFVTRQEQGKKHLYTANISEEETQKKLLDRFVENAFGGSAMKLVMQALGNHKTSKEEIDEIREYLNKIEKNK